ncbi:MAG: TIGR04372 family glycosyltransferase [Alphaproteobacteria bacterium]|nr:TIGR04372 family glycosyltransferase [Alphaproteobacteria bacterium]
MKPDGFQHHFELPPEFLEHGQAFLDDLGWRPGEQIVVLHVREGNFRENLQYHAHRTADIANYLPTIDFLASQGYWVFKIGDNGSNPLTHSNPRVIDLPHLPRYANWMDLFLVARSEFSINCSSGPVSYCHARGTHSLVVNNLAQSFYLFVPTGRFVLMFKTYRDAASGRQLSYAEILERDLSDFSEKHKYEEAGISIEENTADEILKATKEMRARLAGNHQEDEALQSRFRHLGQAYDANRIRRVDEGSASPAMQLSPHCCFGFPFMNIVEAYCRRHPDFLGTEGGTEPNIDTMSR